MKTVIQILSIISLGLVLNACCPFVKADSLGNNFVLSEYDNVDRKILYTEDKCSGSGIEVVPMSVIAYANDSKWVIAKSTKKETGEQYWIVDKDFKVYLIPDNDSTLNIIKSRINPNWENMYLS